MAILIQARLWTAQYEWWAHHPLALKAGLPEQVAADLKEGKRPASMADGEAIVFDYSIELCKTKKVSDPTFRRAMTVLGEQQVVDLTVLIGSYVTVSMVLNAGEVEIPGNATPPLAPMSDPFPPR
jgi:4-carboxymuconolactone decarboxylase